MIEIDNIPCCYCGIDCPTEWKIQGEFNLGMLNNKDFCLIGDCVIHTKCFDILLEQYPI